MDVALTHSNLKAAPSNLINEWHQVLFPHGQNKIFSDKSVAHKQRLIMPREFYSRIMVAHKCCNYNCFVKRYLCTKQWPINDEPVPVDQVAGSFRTFDPSASSRIKLTTCAVEWFNAVKPPTFNFVSNLTDWTSVSSIFSRLRDSLDHNIILVSSFQYQSFDWIIVKWARLELSWFRVQRSCFYKFKGDDKHVSINIENYAIEDSDIDLIWWTKCNFCLV